MKRFVLKSELEYSIPTPATLNLNVDLTNKPEQVEINLFGSYCIVQFWADDYKDACKMVIQDLFPADIVSTVEILDLIEDVTVQPRKILSQLPNQPCYIN